MDDIATDEMDGRLGPKSSDVPEIVFARAGQIGIDGGGAQYASFNSDHPPFHFS